MQNAEQNSTAYAPVAKQAEDFGPNVSGVIGVKTGPAEERPLVVDGETPTHPDAQDDEAQVRQPVLSDRISNRPMSARIWSSVKSTASWMEEGLAEFFGLNESKYEWAIVELEHRNRIEAEKRAKQAQRETELQEESNAYLSALEEQSPSRLLPSRPASN